MQIAIPNEVTAREIEREKSLGGAIALCVRAAGYEPKDLQMDLKWDKAQWSRWESGQEGIVWPKLTALMDYCGNDSPVLWQVHARGYELASIHKRESEVEKQNRQLREENAALRRVLASGVAA